MADENAYGATQNYEPDSGEPSSQATPGAGDVPQEIPERIGRYHVEKVLGFGGFGIVYLAHDEQLARDVTVKVPHGRLIAKPEDAEAYLAEARTVANLDHPHIIPVYDVGSTESCPCYVVSKYIEGEALTQRIKRQRLSFEEATELVATVAEALHYAHQKGVVHRDVKPGNLLLGADGKVYIVDFGLALREENVGKGPKYAGTPSYMSPEQARGEGHRVDGRSDIFSLGVVFYQLLGDRQPFRGDTRAELLEQVTNYEPRPLRQYDDRIPKELERICNKAMAKRASERYSTAGDLAEDLRHFLSEETLIQSGTSPSSMPPVASDTQLRAAHSTVADQTADSAPGSSRESHPIEIVPKGLRSFDAHDAEFFLELLPGPTDRDGLPDSLRFWKTRIEETDPDNTFPVGLLYGPSGCGKSSLVKAGLLPRLSADVIGVFVEATPEETESRLLRGVRKQCPAVGMDLNLKDTLAALRRGEGLPSEKKVLIVLDQFEQWLHGQKDQAQAELVEALRQCDGEHVQCIAMVRDDFWMAATRFMRALEVRLVEAENSAAVDLFPLRHAEKVLTAFGRAFGALPPDLSEEQSTFLKQSVAGLAEEDKVNCVRLALFAEMMKGKPWTTATLTEVGGATGVGTAFLDETFSASTAPPAHRYHQKAARRVLKALLPEPGTSIRGEMKSSQELLEASGYERRPQEFEDLIRILNSELRLITPTDPEGLESEDETLSHVEPAGKYYQLTHDYLVPSLREWLTRKQKETPQGRAELLLEDRVAIWNTHPENRELPSLLQWVQIKWYTDPRRWTPPQKTMMSRASRFHAVRAAAAASLLTIAAFAGFTIRHRVVEQQQANYAAGLVDSVMKADIARVPAVVSDLSAYREWADPLLETKLSQAAEGSAEKLQLSLALLPVDETRVRYLSEQLPRCSLEQFPVVRDALLPHRALIAEDLWQFVQDEARDPSERFQTAAALALYAADDDRWEELSRFVVQRLTSAVSPVHIDDWLRFFQPASDQLSDELTDFLADRNLPGKQREVTALAIAIYLRDQPDKLTDAVLQADEPAEFSALIEALASHSVVVKQRLLDEMNAPLPEEKLPLLHIAHWKRQSLAAVALVQLGNGRDVWPLLKFTQNPSRRSFIIHHLGNLGTDYNTLADRLQDETETSIRRALIQALGGLESSAIPPPDRSRIAGQLQTLYVNDPDACIHSSSAWALRQWGIDLPDLPQSDPVAPANPNQWTWFVDRQGETMVVMPISPGSDNGQIQYHLAIASHEVTVAQYDRSGKPRSVIGALAPSDDCPIHRLDWYRAAEYCNWLSEQEDIPEDQWVYVPNENGEYAPGMQIRPNYPELLGYRLPTGDEWESACRAGTRSMYGFGMAFELLREYGWYVANSSGSTHPVGSLLPNEAGLFDMHGNVWEWAQDPVSGPLTPLARDSRRFMRGGAFVGLAESLHSGNETAARAENVTGSVGFRVVRSIPVPR